MTKLLTEAMAEARLTRSLPDPSDARRLRLTTGITQRQLAEAIGVSTPTICRWERGQRPRGEFVRLYLQALEEMQTELEGETVR